MKNTEVLISGAGVAGITLAYWLRRHGFIPTVVERAHSIRDGGYKIDIRGAALPVVEKMGLFDQIRARVTDVRAGSVVDAKGRRVASMDGHTFGGRTHGDAEILRGDLHRLLFAATHGVEYRWGDSIADLRQSEDRVDVTLASGVTRTFDLVIGADGLHSVTREKAFGSGHVHDLGYRVSIFSVPNHLDLDHEELTYVSPSRTVLVYSTAHDAGAKAMFLFADDAPRGRTPANTSPTATRTRPGKYRHCSRTWARTSTSTNSARCTSTADRTAASHWWATPPTARRSPPGRARASP